MIARNDSILRSLMKRLNQSQAVPCYVPALVGEFARFTAGKARLRRR